MGQRVTSRQGAPAGAASRMTPFLFILAAAVVLFGLAHNYYTADLLDPPHEVTLFGIAPAPYQWRILVPFITDGLVQIAVWFGAVYGQAYAVIAPALFFLSIVGALGAAYLYLRHWFAPALALLGVACVALGAASTLPTFYWLTYSWVEMAFFFLAGWAAFDTPPRAAGGWALRIAIVVLAALNRASGAFIALLFAAATLRKGWKAALANGLVTGLAAVAAHGAVRLAYGPRPNIVSLVYVRDYNFGLLREQPVGTALVALGVLLPVTFALGAGLRHAPRPVLNGLLWVPFYLAAVGVFGIWWESRLFLPIYAALLPINLFGVRAWLAQMPRTTGLPGSSGG